MNERTHAVAKRVSVPVMCLLLGLGALGCGQASSGKAEPRGLYVPDETRTIITKLIPPGQHLRGDGDADNPSDVDGNGDADGNGDVDNDNPTPESYRLPDSDDAAIFSYGHAPDADDRRAITTIVKHYYAAATAENGFLACSLLLPSVEQLVPSEYGGGGGPAYLRGDKTCHGVLSMLFAHLHDQLTEGADVVSVRVAGNEAQVVVSSRKLRASYLTLQRQGDSWRVRGLLGQPLP